MNTQKNLGIWMDHSNAKLIDLGNEQNCKTIESEFDFETKEAALDKGESLMQNKRQQMHEAYYKKLGETILKYEHVLLFGPTNAKTELHNYLNEDLHFKDIKFEVLPADKMTDNQKKAFVKKHFAN